MATKPATAPVTAAGRVGAAALIATFYGARDDPRLVALHDRLCRAFKGIPTNAPPHSCAEPKDATVRWFNPPGASEASVVQVGLNAPGVAAEACDWARRRLSELLDGPLIDGLRRYTLVYEAVLAEDAAPDDGLQELLPAARRLDETAALAPLATAKIKGGWVWLLAVPSAGDGLAAGTVYAALSHKRQEADFLASVFYGGAAGLLMPDLLAHEGYFEMRQLRQGQRYEQRVNGLQAEATKLLDDLQTGPVDHIEIDRLAGAYRRRAPVGLVIDRLRSALSSILYNFGVWEARFGPNAILSFHRRQLEAAAKEAELLVERVHETLESTQTALAIIQVETDRKEAKARERQEKIEAARQGRVQTLLAVIAVAVAVPQLVDPETAAQLLRLVGIPPPTGGERLAVLLGVRVAIGVVLAVLAVAAVRCWARRGSQMDPQPKVSGADTDGSNALK